MVNKKTPSKIFNKLLEKMKSDKLISLGSSIANLLTPIKYSPNGTFDHKYFFTCLIDFVTKCVSWRKYKGTIDHPIDGRYLNQIHNRYVKCGVYDELNKQLLNIYLKKDKEKKLKNQMIDSSFIANKNGSVKNNNHLLKDEVKKKNIKIRKENKKLPKNKREREQTYIDFNRYNGRKKYHKVSLLTDSYGIPLSAAMISSKQSDAISVEDTINNLHVNLNTLRNSKINRYKQNILGDSLYDSNKNNKYLRTLGYNPMIRYNKRNTKNKKIIKRNQFTKKEKEIYKKRFKIESSFAWIKNFPVINQNYQKKIESYNGLFLLAACILISKKV